MTGPTERAADSLDAVTKAEQLVLVELTPVDRVDRESPNARRYSVPFMMDDTWGRMRLLPDGESADEFETKYRGLMAVDARGRLGDVAVLARDAVSYDDPADTGAIVLRCRHGSLTAAEVRVPLVASRGA